MEIRLFLPRAIDPSKSLPIPASPPFSSPLGNHPSPPGETAVEVFPGHSDAAGQRDIGHLMLGLGLEIPAWFPEGLAAPSTLQGGIHVPELSTAWCGPRGRGELRTQSMCPVLCKGHPQPCRPIPHGGLSSSGCSRLCVRKGVSGNQPVGLLGCCLMSLLTPASWDTLLPVVRPALWPPSPPAHAALSKPRPLREPERSRIFPHPQPWHTAWEAPLVTCPSPCLLCVLQHSRRRQ